ncbi:hypothetical protein JNW91_04250 [Micromonospora sp. STR1_7]|uniref:DUF222 domain-containing protein n=1 Tax=Micromonospora parastrephiae TaxID=2806101 RepID=A0ABS1XPJ2_9ACTN|nr:hypothetical protein [Micromonospora parastrephiae]MBM0231157.1 hypothetical protein [Micromonospora parastrephiae]
MNPTRPSKPPMRFTDAEKINPFQLLLDLQENAAARTPESGRVAVLAELALSAAMVSCWTHWQPSMIHTALCAGVDLTDTAKATGLDAGEVVDRWRRWVDVQTGLDIGGRPSVDPVEVHAIERRLGQGVVR